MKISRWRIFSVLFLTLLSFYTVVPTVIYFAQPAELRNDADYLKQKIPSWLPSKHISLGLDLQGGVQLALGVSTDEAVDNKLGRIATEITRWAQDNNQPVKTAFTVKGKQLLRVELNEGADDDKFREAFKKEHAGLSQVAHEGNSYDFGYPTERINEIRQSAMEQALRIIRSRIDKWGVSEALVTRRGNNAIVVQLPGFKDPEKAKELLGRTAQLKFKLVDDEFAGFDSMTQGLPEEIKVEQVNGHVRFTSENREALLALVKGKVPENREVLLGTESLAGGKKANYRTYVVEAATELAGEDVMDAFVSQGSDLDNRPEVALRFTSTGGRRFADLTGKNVNRRMAIVLDDVVQSAPVIQTKIAGGEARIRLGGGTMEKGFEEAKELAVILKSGALPATIFVMEQRQVGASLGPELANQGIRGALGGLVLVILFMIIYYRRPGTVACIALVLNGVLLLASMAAFGFALSLPGIAGLILTLGMAVDANVLINERIRQELREGKNAKKSVENGFDRSFWTIIDGHVTTLIAAFVLLETNPSGPIRGFSISLIIGLIISLYTSINVTKLLFHWFMSRKKNEKEARHWLGETGDSGLHFNFDYLKLGRPLTIGAMVVSLAIIAISLGKGLNLGVDFKGGTELVLGFQSAANSEAIEKAAGTGGAQNITIQSLGTDEKQFVLRFDSDVSGRTPKEVIDTVTKSIAAAMTDLKPEVLQTDYVGPQVGKELRIQGILSVIYSIVGVLIYIALRFDMRFGPGAGIKMVIDVGLLLGFYLFFGRTFDLTSVAAFLTIVGYSVNDTIVIYDRIRENLALHGKRRLDENINASLNETLTRSVNTSMTVVLSLLGIIFYGTGQLWDFAMAMVIGVVIVSLTSVFIASSFVLWSERWLKSRAAVSKTAMGTGK